MTELATRDSARVLLEKMSPQFEKALAKHIPVEKFVRVALTTLNRTPELLKCTQESLLGCLLDCAQLGLEPDSVLGYAYLIPFHDRKEGVTKCTLIPGYKGLVDLARRSGELKEIYADVVHEGDQFQVVKGLNRDLVHVPNPKPERKVTHAYAVAKFKDGGFDFVVMTRAEVDAIRMRSKAGSSGPWKDFYEEMGKKTVLRRLCKMLPLSPEFRRAAEMDNAHYGFEETRKVRTITLPPLEGKEENASEHSTEGELPSPADQGVA